MQLGYQLLNFDLSRAMSGVEALARSAPAVRRRLSTITLGDASCTFRNQHTLAAVWDAPEWVRFRAWRREQGLRLLWQLPLVAKESEFRLIEEVAGRLWPDVDGFLTGDVGLLLALQEGSEARGARELVFTGNVLNRRTASILTERVPGVIFRPLMPRRAFLERDPGVPRDVVAYGNLMINSSIFCFHCGDLPTRCDFSCEAPKHLVMEHERMAMVGRSLYTTEAHLDMIDLLPALTGLARATLVDLDLQPDERIDAFRRMAAAVPEVSG